MAKKSRKGVALKDPAERRTHRLQTYVTLAEKRDLMARFDANSYRSVTEYLRDRLLRGRVTVRTRDASLDEALPVLQAHNEELRSLGVNVNQVVRHLNTYRTAASPAEARALTEALTRVAECVTESQNLLHEIHERWSRT